MLLNNMTQATTRSSMDTDIGRPSIETNTIGYLARGSPMNRRLGLSAEQLGRGRTKRCRHAKRPVPDVQAPNRFARIVKNY
jgi:hypothetical protein